MRRRQPRSPSKDRDDPQAKGDRGEQLAADHLVGLGYRIVARNLRTRLGEIDVLARSGRLWVAIEVKTRSGHPAPERCVDQAQLRRVEAALRAIAPTLRPRPRWLRVDIAAVRIGGSVPTEVRLFEGSPFRPCER